MKNHRDLCPISEHPDYQDTGYEPPDHPEFKSNNHAYHCVCKACQQLIKSEREEAMSKISVEKVVEIIEGIKCEDGPQNEECNCACDQMIKTIKAYEPCEGCDSAPVDCVGVAGCNKVTP
jgi:hypothetical protein